jgi:hypothetical protein
VNGWRGKSANADALAVVVGMHGALDRSRGELRLALP